MSNKMKDVAQVLAAANTKLIKLIVFCALLSTIQLTYSILIEAQVIFNGYRNNLV